MAATMRVRSEIGGIRGIRLLGVALGLTIAITGIKVHESYSALQEPERADYLNLSGPGYNISRSRLGENVLEIRSWPLLPFQQSDEALNHGITRVTRNCADSDKIIFEVAAGNRAYAKVPNAPICFFEPQR